ncbi:MAG TPA: hypothetical protein DCR40_18190 [Prolixibacteraceae bacterium]|nr:hypothetical protein [Prolixibacteraceae bacterium]
MASNRRYFLERVIMIQTIVKEEKRHGKTQTWIFDNIIRLQHPMSRSTFNNYMCINAKRELAKLGPNGLP